jgi:isopentenyl diphosphate isomerase/L-lactate dehydrogenase-like FMN-dependent dehydrogenase
MDGGIRRGTDILKALALGARAVLIGRPVIWGLAVDGEAGVYGVLRILEEELRLAMMLAGRPAISRIDRSLVKITGAANSIEPFEAEEDWRAIRHSRRHVHATPGGSDSGFNRPG